MSSAADSDLTVVVLTRRRIGLLDLALRSLAGQQGVQFDVIVVVDDCPPTAEHLESLPSSFKAVRSLRCVHARRGAGERSGPCRIARLREMAVGLVKTPWSAFLDDDNTLEPEHISTLLQCVVHNQAPAAHSWRSVWTRDGQRFTLSGRHPWCREPHSATRLFLQYEAAGIYQRKSHVIRDQVIPHFRNLSMVDTSEWIFRTGFLKGLEFSQDYTLKDWQLGRTEDSKLLDQIVELGISIPSTRRPTLRYRLGGYSNDTSHEAAEIAGWTS